MRVALAGSVSFSERTLAKLLEHGVEVVGVLGLSPEYSSTVSDYVDLQPLAASAGVPFVGFRRINSPEVAEQLRVWSPDVIFVIGLSQMVDRSIIELAPRGAVGFHPTRLPEGRGRAPIAWLAYDGQPGAATFFALEERADAGAIHVQEPFDVPPGSYAGEVLLAARAAIDRALDQWLPRLIAGDWSPEPQDESRASWFGRRAPEDGLITWNDSAADICRLVRAVSRPYPGAYTHHRDAVVRVWRATVSAAPYRGVVGRVLDVSGPQLLVQTGAGLLLVQEWELADGHAGPATIHVGARLGMAVEDEILRLRRKLAQLEAGLSASSIPPASSGGIS